VRKTQTVLRQAPSDLNWPPPIEHIESKFPDVFQLMLDYDPKKRPLLCLHFSNILYLLIRDIFLRNEEIASPSK
jgi:hypothetical protein